MGNEAISVDTQSTGNPKYIPSKPRIEVGMPFGNVWDTHMYARQEVWNKYGETAHCGYHDSDIFYGSGYFKDSKSKIFEASQRGHAAYLTYSGYDDPSEKIQFSNGYNKYKSHPVYKDCAQFDTIQVSYRDENGHIQNQYAVDKNGDGFVNSDEIFDGWLP